METPEISNLKQIQEAFSSMTGLSLSIHSSDGNTVCDPVLENPICQQIQTTPKGQKHCQSHCGRSLEMALQSQEPVFFKCNAGLHVFSVPIIADKSNPKANFTFQGGKAFFEQEEFLEFQNLAEKLEINPLDVSRLQTQFRRVDNKVLTSAARYLEATLSPLIKTLHEKNTLAIRSTRLMALFNLFSQLHDDRSLKDHSAMLLNTLGILFGLRTASVMILDTKEKRFKTEAVFGQKAAQVANYSADSLSGLIGDLYEKAGPVSSHNTLEILRLGLPAEISQAHFFPILVRSADITGVLGIFDTPLTDEEISLISTFCQEVSVYEEIKGLRSEQSELTKDMTVILDIAKAVGSVLESEELFNIILEKSAGFLDAEQGSVLLLDEERKDLTVRAVKGLNKKIVELLRVQPGEGIAGKVFSTGVPLLVRDIQTDDRISQDKRPRYKTNSFISIPLRLDGRIFGVLNVADKSSGRPFSQEDLHILISIGTFAAMAIERSHFYHKTKELKKISITDSLTGLLNRRYFQERISEEMERSRRHRVPLSLIMVDMDNFKAINDTYGHTVGDEVLKVAARCLRNCIRTIDVAARFGGEEFTVILPQTGKEDASVIANRICQEIRKLDCTVGPSGERAPLSVSLGLATFPEDAGGIQTLIRNSDVALYLAKTQGKNRVVLYNKSATP